MRIEFKAATIVLFLITAFLFIACGGDSEDDPTAADPVVHTILSASNVENSMIGLAIKDQYVFAAFVSGDTKVLNLYRSSDSGETFAFVDSTSHSLFAAGRPAVRAAITDDDTLYVAYRQFEFGPGHHIGIVQVDDALTASDYTSDSLALGGTSVTTGNMDVINYENTLFVPFTDSAPYSARFLSADFTNASDIDNSLTGIANEGGIAGIAQSDTKWKAAYVNSDSPNSAIWCAKTADSGTIWSPVLVTAETGYVENLDIFAVNDFAIISYYYDDNVYVRYSSDNGVTWSVAKLISAAYDDMTSIAKSTAYLNLVFTRNNGQDLCLARSSNNGVSWSVTTLVDELSSGTKFPEIQASGNTICIAYRTGDGIFLLKSANDGALWD